ncbi:NepR family anti-sigma factor [Sphingosinicella sp. LHD-64]|uniref:NepR family anti-sigma factor n=1 Tax=Sphingosinicella sp. LHD-64 TaxID=3072139 RepID=UPI00280CE161|nr:NepR family anti-sigma factor [Sphingosinicella sp. LHD-64]MDQ8758203.1 NepR family anti-sigma factor [Sphingosinicella sp. LHD-64]
MSVQADRDKQRKRRTETEEAPVPSPKSTRNRKESTPGNVGDALRSVYQRTVDEDIPPEMLDLLGKLG